MKTATVFLTPTGLFSPAMTRIARALEASIPEGFSVTQDKALADVIVLYAIGRDAIGGAAALLANGQRYVVVQCCLKTSGAKAGEWSECWLNSEFVWSYYDLSKYASEFGFKFYHAPLGLDEAFRSNLVAQPRLRRVITSGTVAGAGAEAIEEVWIAAARTGVSVLHVGQNPVGLITGVEPDSRVAGVTDAQLASLYQSATWVSGLRHIEGFELPAAEGLACGARPILFDRQGLERWYGDHAVFVRDGDGLIEALVEVFAKDPREVSDSERKRVLSRFCWDDICKGFWSTMGGAW